MAGDADVVAAGDDGRAGSDVAVVAGDDRAGEVDAGNERIRAGNLAVGLRGQTVLEVDGRPFDADGDFARREVVRREVAKAALEFVFRSVDHVGAKSLGNVGHRGESTARRPMSSRASQWAGEAAEVWLGGARLGRCL